MSGMVHSPSSKGRVRDITQSWWQRVRVSRAVRTPSREGGEGEWCAHGLEELQM